MTITINNKEYKIKYTLRAIFLFEQITDKPFEIKTLLDNYVFYYAMLLANNGDEFLDWDEFIDAIDNDPKLVAQLAMFMTAQEKKQNVLNPDEDIKDNKNPKKKLKQKK